MYTDINARTVRYKNASYHEPILRLLLHAPTENRGVAGFLYAKQRESVFFFSWEKLSSREGTFSSGNLLHSLVTQLHSNKSAVR